MYLLLSVNLYLLSFYLWFSITTQRSYIFQFKPFFFSNLLTPLIYSYFSSLSPSISLFYSFSFVIPLPTPSTILFFFSPLIHVSVCLCFFFMSFIVIFQSFSHVAFDVHFFLFFVTSLLLLFSFSLNLFNIHLILLHFLLLRLLNLYLFSFPSCPYRFFVNLQHILLQWFSLYIYIYMYNFCLIHLLSILIFFSFLFSSLILSMFFYRNPIQAKWPVFQKRRFSYQKDTMTICYALAT